MGKYDDIVNLPHHVSKKHPHMSMLDRAAQFSPFMALTGYGAAVKETERIVESRIEPDGNRGSDSLDDYDNWEYADFYE